MVTYQFTKEVLAHVLADQIKAAGLTDLVQVDTLGNEAFCRFNSTLTDGQVGVLNGVVQSHKAKYIRDVTPRQMRQALVLSGVTTTMIEGALAGLPEPQQSLARIEWEYSTAFIRSNKFVNQVGAMLGWSETQLDDLWHLAGTL